MLIANLIKIDTDTKCHMFYFLGKNIFSISAVENMYIWICSDSNQVTDFLTFNNFLFLFKFLSFDLYF